MATDSSEDKEEIKFSITKKMRDAWEKEIEKNRDELVKQEIIWGKVYSISEATMRERMEV